MTKEEAIYILRNTAWLGGNEQVKKVEEAIDTAERLIPNKENKMDDLISRQSAIDALYHVDEYNGRSVEAIRNLPSAQQWIPCSERMPNPNELNGNVIKYYLVQNVFGDMLVCDWNGKEWGLIYSYETEVPEDVAAWMPLPEPYKGKDNETD